MKQIRVLSSEKLTGPIIHLSFENQYLMNATMCRVQEFYEAPQLELKGQVFSLEQFLDIQGQSGYLDYFIKWSGDNVPGNVFVDWVSKFTGKTPFLEKELELINLVKDCSESLFDSGKFYVIGTYGNNDATEHELAHSFFYLSEDYKKEILQIINDTRKQFVEELFLLIKNIGYCDDVLPDELNAFVVTEDYDSFFGRARKYTPEEDILDKVEYNALKDKLSIPFDKMIKILVEK